LKKSPLNLTIGIMTVVNMRRLEWAQGVLEHFKTLGFEEGKTWLRDEIEEARKSIDDFGSKGFERYIDETEEMIDHLR
jgi:hypothetical protein